MAQSVRTVTDRPVAGGAARPVAVVSDEPGTGGPATPVVVVTDGRPQAGGPPLRVVLASADQPTAGDAAAIPVYVVSGTLGAPTIGTPTLAAMNTTATTAETEDGHDWAQARPIVVDAFERIALYIQWSDGTKRNTFVFSNDGGQTWTDNAGISGGELFLERGTIIYDATLDCYHGLLITVNPGDGGVIYRRYAITRDGANAITSIARVAGVSVVLDGADGSSTPADQYQHPDLCLIGRTLYASWNARVTASGNEIRAVRCDLTGNADAGGTATNWTDLGVASASTLGQVPVTASYTAIVANTTGGIPYHTLQPLTSGNLCCGYHNGDAPGQWRYRRLPASGGGFTLGTDALITAVQRSGVDTGYSLKKQLIGPLQEDAAGNVVIGIASWKDDTAGDTWGYARISPADGVTLVDVASAGGAHSYAPTGDVRMDVTSGLLVVSWLESGTNDVYAQLWDGTASAGDPVRVGSGADIPLLYPRFAGTQVLVSWRVQGAPPQSGQFGTLTWS